MDEPPGDAMDWTPEQALDKARELVREGREGGREVTALMVVLLSETSKQYGTRTVNCGLTKSQQIALMEIAKDDVLRAMNVEDEEE